MTSCNTGNIWVYHPNDIMECLTSLTNKESAIDVEFIEISVADFSPGWVEYCDVFTGKCLYRIEMTRRNYEVRDGKEASGSDYENPPVEIIDSHSTYIIPRENNSPIPFWTSCWWFLREIFGLSFSCDFLSSEDTNWDLMNLRRLMLQEHLKTLKSYYIKNS
ncbi:uncharacterized protein [Centruroides vittatus]|uniref:uncharacterized protein n=1 Tax=Centruroides vittatus TaxID=120091 RepID=UPI00350F9267